VGPCPPPKGTVIFANRKQWQVHPGQRRPRCRIERAGEKEADGRWRRGRSHKRTRWWRRSGGGGRGEPSPSVWLAEVAGHRPTSLHGHQPRFGRGWGRAGSRRALRRGAAGACMAWRHHQSAAGVAALGRASGVVAQGRLGPTGGVWGRCSHSAHLPLLRQARANPGGLPAQSNSSNRLDAVDGSVRPTTQRELRSTAVMPDGQAKQRG
jgi:hypothetical protein